MIGLIKNDEVLAAEFQSKTDMTARQDETASGVVPEVLVEGITAQDIIGDRFREPVEMNKWSNLGRHLTHFGLKTDPEPQL